MSLILQIALGMLLGVVLIVGALSLTVASWKARARIVLHANKAAKYTTIALVVCAFVFVFGYITYLRSDMSEVEAKYNLEVTRDISPCFVPPVVTDCYKATSLGYPTASMTFSSAFSKGFADTSLAWLFSKIEMNDATTGATISESEYRASRNYLQNKWHPGMTESMAELIFEREVRDFEVVWAERGPRLYFWAGYCIGGAFDPIYFLLCALLWRAYKDRTDKRG